MAVREWRDFLWILVPIGAGIILYAGVAGAPFIYDDIPYVVNNPLVTGEGTLTQVWTSSFPPDTPFAGLYRPVTATTYLLDHSLFGLNAAAFHRLNILWHSLAAGAFFLLLRALGLPLVTALLGGLLFAVHPVHTEAVSWIVGRAEVLAGLFTFCAVLAWIAFCRRGGTFFSALAAVLYLLGMGSKETAASLPAVLLLGDWLGLWTGDRASAAMARVRARIPGYTALAVALALYLALRLHALGRFGIAEEWRAFAGTDAAARLATAFAGLLRSLTLTVVPQGLRVEYGDFVREGFADPAVVVGIAALAGLVGLALWARRRHRWLTFWIGWFLLFLTVTSNFVFEIGAVYAERFLYLPSAAGCAVGAIVMGKGLEKGARLPVRTITALAAAAWIAFFSWQTVERNRVWADRELFWRTAAAQSPSSQKILHHLGSFLNAEGTLLGRPEWRQEAAKVFRRGIALRGSSSSVTSDHIAMVAKLGMIRYYDRQYELAFPLLRQALALTEGKPRFLGEARVWVMRAFGETLAALDRPGEAAAVLEKVTGEFPEVAAEAIAGMAKVYLGRDEKRRAADLYGEALKRRGDFAPAHFGIGNIKLRKGETEEGLTHLEKAVKPEKGEDFGPAHARLLREVYGDLVREGRYNQAYPVFRKIVEVEGESPEGVFTLGRFAEEFGDLEEAKRRYRRTLDLEPVHGEAAARLAELEK